MYLNFTFVVFSNLDMRDIVVLDLQNWVFKNLAISVSFLGSFHVVIMIFQIGKPQSHKMIRSPPQHKYTPPNYLDVGSTMLKNNLHNNPISFKTRVFYGTVKCFIWLAIAIMWIFISSS